MTLKLQVITEARIVDEHNNIRFSVTDTSFDHVNHTLQIVNVFKRCVTRVTGRVIRQLDTRYANEHD